MLVRKHGESLLSPAVSSIPLTSFPLLPLRQFDESKANLIGSCTQPCGGDPTENCGNAGKLSIYKYDPNKTSSSISSTMTTTTATTMSTAQLAAVVAPPPTTTTSSTRSTTTSTTTSSASTSSSTSKVPAGWHYRGCYVDNLTPRSLPDSGMWYDVPMTPSACTDHCTQKGFAIAGTEYAGELSFPFF